MTRLHLKNIVPILLPLLSAITLFTTPARGIAVIWGADFNNNTDPNGDGSELCSIQPDVKVTAFLVFYGKVQPPTELHDPTSTGFFFSGSDVLGLDEYEKIAPIYDPYNPYLFTAYYVDEHGIIRDKESHEKVENSISGPFYIEYELTPKELEAGSFFYDPLGLGTALGSLVEVDDAEGLWRIIIYDPYNSAYPNDPYGTYGYFEFYATPNDYDWSGDEVTLHLTMSQGQWPFDYIEVGAVPEPATAMLLCLGAAIFGVRRSTSKRFSTKTK